MQIFDKILLLIFFISFVPLLSINRRLVYRLRASAWQVRDLGFIPGWVTLKTLKIVGYSQLSRQALGTSGSANGFVYV